jgi:hypothetical protein
MEEWRYSCAIINLGTRYRWVDRFTLQPLYPLGKGPPYPLDRMLGWPQSRSGCLGGGVEKISYHCRECNPDRPSRSPLLFRLSHPEPQTILVTTLKPVNNISNMSFFLVHANINLTLCSRVLVSRLREPYTRRGRITSPGCVVFPCLPRVDVGTSRRSGRTYNYTGGAGEGSRWKWRDILRGGRVKQVNLDNELLATNKKAWRTKT